MTYRFFLETEIALRVDLNKQSKQFGGEKKRKLALNSRRRRFGSGAGQELHEPLFNAALGVVLSVEET